MKTKRKKIWKRIWVGLLIFVSLLALPWIWNWISAHRSWNEALAYLEEKGESLVWEDHLPEPLDPDVEYFCEHPMLAALVQFDYDRETDTTTFHQPELRAKIASLHPDEIWIDAPRARGREPQDFEALAEHLSLEVGEDGPAAAVLESLSKHDAGIAELAEAARLPAGHFREYLAEPGRIVFQPMHFMTDFVKVSRTCLYRVRARLAIGPDSKNVEELRIVFGLARIAEQDPTLLGYLVSITLQSLAVTAVWEGLARESWTPADLDQVNQILADLKPVESLIRATRAERICAVETFNGMKSEDVKELDDWALFYFPGVLKLNRTNMVYFYQSRFIDPLVAEDFRFFARTDLEALPDEVKGSWFPPNFALAEMTLISTGKMGRKGIRQRMVVDQARLAIALEQHKLAHGAYPEKLADLGLPEVPRDLLADAPMSYALDPENGRYRIWSVGWDFVDNGGAETSDDLTWTYPSGVASF